MFLLSQIHFLRAKHTKHFSLIKAIIFSPKKNFIFRFPFPKHIEPLRGLHLALLIGGRGMEPKSARMKLK